MYVFVSFFQHPQAFETGESVETDKSCEGTVVHFFSEFRQFKFDSILEFSKPEKVIFTPTPTTHPFFL